MYVLDPVLQPTSTRKLMDTAASIFSSRSATSLEHEAVPPRCVRVSPTQADRALDFVLP
jgi:hypothetical protein